MSNNWKINKTVDLARGIDGVEVWPHALLVTGDENAHEWNVTVMDNGKAASLGGSIRAYFVRSDGATVTAAGSVAGNVATVTLPEACYAYEGDLQAVMQLIQDDVSVTLSALLLRVRQISTDVIVDPGSEIPSLDDLLAQIEKLKQATKDANAATTKANQAATEAETRVDEAISDAEGRVNTAVQSAETATSKANASATKADTATANANTAAQKALDAAKLAEQAASGVGLRKEVLDHIPEPSEMAENVIYLVPAAEPNPENTHEEYMLIDGQRELIGSTAVDLTGYAKKDELADVATSGSYEDLTETPELADVATSGSYADLSDTEDVATKNYVVGQIENIEVGGRNWLHNSTDPFMSIHGTVKATITKNVSVEEWNTSEAIRVTGNGGTGDTLVFVIANNPYTDLLANTYTESLYIKNNGSKDIRFGRLSYTVVHPGESGFRSVSFTVEPGTKPGLQIQILTIDIGDEFDVTFWHPKVEIGNKATDWSPAPEDVDRAISRRSAVTYDYGGQNLKEVFGTPEALHTALAAEDYSQIAVGDYWPITLNGTFWDYGGYTVQSGVKYYSNNTLQTQAGTTAAIYEGTYVSDTAVSFSLSGTTYYAAVGDCLPYFERTCNNVTVKLEVAGINHYWRYGDSGDLAGNKPHIVFISRDCLPFKTRMRKGSTKWEDEAATNPWIGSAMFKTLNDETHGVLPLVATTDVGDYIYAGPNNLGMRAILDKKAHDAANATGWTWYDRGKLFLPSVAEVWGHPFWAEMNWESGLGNQFAIFRDSLRHISKGGGDNAGRVAWWLGSSSAGSYTNFVFANGGGFASSNAATNTFAVPVCFIFA